MDDELDRLELRCGCTLTEEPDATGRFDLVVRPCSESHSDWLVLKAIEHGLGNAGITYRREQSEG